MIIDTTCSAVERKMNDKPEIILSSLTLDTPGQLPFFNFRESDIYFTDTVGTCTISYNYDYNTQRWFHGYNDTVESCYINNCVTT